MFDTPWYNKKYSYFLYIFCEIKNCQEKNCLQESLMLEKGNPSFSKMSSFLEKNSLLR